MRDIRSLRPEDNFIDDSAIRVKKTKAVLISVQREGDMIGTCRYITVGDELEKSIASNKAQRRKRVLLGVCGVVLGLVVFAFKHVAAVVSVLVCLGVYVKLTEKNQSGENWINGGFFVIEPEIFKYIKGDNTYLERNPLEKIASLGKLVAFKHYGFWQCMDTLRDKEILEKKIKNYF